MTCTIFLFTVLHTFASACLTRARLTPGENSHMKGVGMLVGNFQLKPKRKPIRAWPKCFWLLKETMLENRQIHIFYISSRATLNETFTAKYNGVLPRTPSVGTKSEIYTPKRDNQHRSPLLSYMSHHPPWQRWSKLKVQSEISMSNFIREIVFDLMICANG